MLPQKTCRHALALLSIVFLFLASAIPDEVSPPWGFFGHRKINRQAIFILPPEMMFFFKKNIDYLTEHAVDADKRRYVSPYEAVRHYIDLDIYGEFPFEHVPRSWTDALIRFAPVYFVNEELDTLPLLVRDASGEVADSLSKVTFHPSLTDSLTAKVPYRDFRRFFAQNFLPGFYEANWAASCDSLAPLLDVGPDQFRCKKLFAIDHLSEHGLLPWHLQHMLRRLTNAFVEMDEKKIRRYAADIGHYIGDAHVPLHTTENYNGQLTGQIGIHAFWESRLPELFADDRYEFWVGKAQFIENPRDYFWNIVLESHALVDSVLLIEADLRQRFPSDQQMCYETRGEMLVHTQCEAYASAYHQRMGNMVEQRMRDAILSVGSAWYTAWVLAGQPDLRLLEGGVVVDSQDVGEVEEKEGIFKIRKHAE